jgi:3',5'-cyclic AMP phosphodiesterase CpdA
MPYRSPAPRERHKGARLLLVALLVICAALGRIAAQELALPNTPGSVKFAVIGDSGTGDSAQYQVAQQMLAFHGKFAFDRVIMLGDDIYGGQGPPDLVRKFSLPYKALLDAGVKFYAALGNHDDPANRSYPLWNMGGERYYTHAEKNVRFFVLDSDQLDPKQIVWITDALKNSHDDWKICYFHHPLYSDGMTHGSSVDLRIVLEPLFVTYGVIVVFSGHDHIYERITPQKGITYFVSGAAGQLRKGDTKKSAMTAASFDQDQSFMLVEVGGNDLAFQAISRTGVTVDKGTIHRQVR